MAQYYDKGNCGLCGKSVRRNGLAMVSHLRAHVRKGELIEFSGGSLPNKFRLPDEGFGGFAVAAAYF